MPPDLEVNISAIKRSASEFAKIVVNDYPELLIIEPYLGSAG